MAGYARINTRQQEDELRPIQAREADAGIRRGILAEEIEDEHEEASYRRIMSKSDEMHEELAKRVWRSVYPDRRPWDDLDQSTQDEWKRFCSTCVTESWKLTLEIAQR